MQKRLVANLDARRFCRGYTNPLAMMGVALDRYLPGRNAMLVNESYVIKANQYLRADDIWEGFLGSAIR